ncbi:MAG TPA: cation-translocating P-type ATPase [Acidimicrobiia bacterium]|nr:cation-translocating P-type ATPase [Acidimicrobiia bacterium]
MTTPLISQQRAAVERRWHKTTVDEILDQLDTSPEGLTTAEAQQRLISVGANELEDKGSKNPIKILIEQVTAVMVLILIGAVILSLILGKYLEAGAIGTIIVLFAMLGFFQEYRAEKAIAALRKMSVPIVRGMRNGQPAEFAAHDIVPGDIIFLEAGSIVPADMRLIETANLRIEEASLTGESEAAEKDTGVKSDPKLSIGDRTNMAYSGTQVTYGRGTAVVVSTGMSTEIGRIATLLQSVDNGHTPLQQKLDSVGKQLAILGVVVAFIVMAFGALAGESISEMMLTAISVAVAVIPEGLPAVVTFTLAIGSQRMLKRNALIRKLPAVETLGSVTVICSDKTGTLTQNKMTATSLDVWNHTYDMSTANSSDDLNVQRCLRIGALCNDGTISTSDSLTTFGDPTETSLLVAAHHNSIDVNQLRIQYPRVNENPFDSTRKRMSTIHKVDFSSDLGKTFLLSSTSHVAFVKGALDGILHNTVSVCTNSGITALSPDLVQRIESANDAMAKKGMRVLALAYRSLDESYDSNVAEQELVFVGLVGIIDPARPEVASSVALCKQAGIRPIMITGDHPLTALAIAQNLGITSTDQCAVGSELEEMTDAELIEVTKNVSVYARVSPEHKLRIVQALQDQNHIVAMTGDGVNDAPALKRADIGVSMGITGTDVTKEASDMILRDDNFATIVSAVEEGRVIYDNLRRFVKFAVAGNIGKIIIMVCWPLPFIFSGNGISEAVALLPLQLLWLNLMTDGLLGISMGIEPAEKGVMNRMPHKPGESMWANGLGKNAFWIGTYIGCISLAIGYLYYANDKGNWQTMIFMTVALLQVFQAIATRSSTESIFTLGLRTNPAMLAICGAVIFLQLFVAYTPLSTFLNLDTLSPVDFLIATTVGASLLLVTEFEKAWRRKYV